MPGEARRDTIPLLAADEPRPVETVRPGAPSPFLLVCDHASNFIPRALGDLGLDAAALARHVAWDIGAAAMTRDLAARLDATAILSRFSRLVVDPNRSEDDATSMPETSDDVAVPGNRGLGAAQRQARLETFARPYHRAIAAGIARRRAERQTPILLSMHSFTPVMNGFARPWEVGILWNRDGRLAKPLLQSLAARGYAVGDNEPYTGRDFHGFTLHHHAEPGGLPHVLFEIRQDLIDTHKGALRWADNLAPVLAERLADPALHRPLQPSDED